MTKKKIAVIYDTSYLLGDFQPIQKFVLARRLSSQEKKGILGFLKRGADHKVHHEPGDLFVVSEIVPTEVMREVDRDPANGKKGQERIAGLLADGASKVDLSMDTVVGGSRKTSADAGETDEKLILYASRLVSHGTLEKYDLVIVATDDEGLLLNVAKKAEGGKEMFGVKSEHITRTRLLHDKLTEMANRGRANKITMEN